MVENADGDAKRTKLSEKGFELQIYEDDEDRLEGVILF